MGKLNLSNFSKTDYEITKTFNYPTLSNNPIKITASIFLDTDGGGIVFENDFNDYVFSHDGGDYTNEKELFEYLELGWEHYFERLEGVEEEKLQQKTLVKQIKELVNQL